MLLAKEKFELQIDRQISWDKEANRLNSVGEVGDEIVGASTDLGRGELPGNKVYINFTTGNDTTGDGSIGNPYKTQGKYESIYSPGDVGVWMDGSALTADINYPIMTLLGTQAELDGTGKHWNQETPAASPPQRRAPGMAGIKGEIFLFGGWESDGDTYYDDTWKYDGINWVELTTLNDQPSERFETTMAELEGIIYLFGGNDGNTKFNDTWKFDPANGDDAWELVITSESPPIQSGGKLVKVDGKLILFNSFPDDTDPNGTWQFDPVNGWVNLNPSISPVNREFYSAAESNGKLYLFGGTRLGVVRGDWWVFENGNWSQIGFGGGGPAARKFHVMFTAGNRFYLFGGLGAAAYDDVWEFDGVSLTKIIPTATPGTRYLMAIAQLNNKFYMYGGESPPAGDETDETWQFSLKLKIDAEILGFNFTPSIGITSECNIFENNTFNNNTNLHFSDRPIINYNKNMLTGTAVFIYSESTLLNFLNNASDDASVALVKNTALETRVKNNAIKLQNLAGKLGRNTFEIESDKLIFRENLIESLLTTKNVLKIDGAAAIAEDLVVLQNTIIGNVILDNTGSTGLERFRDNIIKGNMTAAVNFIMESGNMQGAIIGFSTSSEVSNVDPFFVDSIDYELRRESEGFSSDSLMIARSFYETYNYSGDDYPKDLGCYNMNNATKEIFYENHKSILRAEDIEHIGRQKAKLNFAKNGNPDVTNKPDERAEVIVLKYVGVLSQDNKYFPEMDVLTFIDQLESLSDMRVRLALDSEFSSLSNIIVSGAHNAGEFVINIDASPIPLGARVTIENKEYTVINRDPAFGDATRIVLNRKTEASLVDDQEPPVKGINGLGEFKYVPENDKSLKRWDSQDPKNFTGLTLTFVRKRP